MNIMLEIRIAPEPSPLRFSNFWLNDYGVNLDEGYEPKVIFKGFY